MTETIISQTPNGRDIRMSIRDGREVFFVQPPRDNYWVEGQTPLAAMRNAGWKKSDGFVAEYYRGDWRTW